MRHPGCIQLFRTGPAAKATAPERKGHLPGGDLLGHGRPYSQGKEGRIEFAGPKEVADREDSRDDPNAHQGGHRPRPSPFLEKSARGRAKPEAWPDQEVDHLDIARVPYVSRCKVANQPNPSPKNAAPPGNPGGLPDRGRGRYLPSAGANYIAESPRFMPRALRAGPGDLVVSSSTSLVLPPQVLVTSPTPIRSLW